MPRGTASKQKTELDFYETTDVDGNVVRIPQSKNIDGTIPVKDADGRVPEYVNVSGKTQKHALGFPQESDTITVPPFGILKGKQWEAFTEASKAWGDFPPYLERIRIKGEYDEEYVLTEKQALQMVDWVKSWKYGPERLEMFEKQAKVQKYDKVGRPMIPIEELMEDRSKVSQAISIRKTKLMANRKENMDILTGRKY